MTIFRCRGCGAYLDLEHTLENAGAPCAVCRSEVEVLRVLKRWEMLRDGVEVQS